MISKKCKFMILACLLHVYALLGSPTKDSLSTIPLSLLQKDFLELKDSLLMVHPDLYRYQDRKSIDKLFNNYYKSLIHDKTELEFYADIKQLTSSIQDGHLYSWSVACENYLNEKAMLFPFKIQFLKSGAYSFCGSETTLGMGRQIIAINGMPIEKLKAELFKYMLSDGAIQTNKYHELSDRFSFYYFMVYGHQDNFKVSYINQKNKIDTISVKADYNKNILCNKNTAVEQKLLDLEFKNNGLIGILTIRTFSHQELTKSKIDFKNFLDSAFTALRERKTDKLIIDLRNNGGGRDTYGALLYSYLTDKQFGYYASLKTATRELTGSDHPNLLSQKAQNINFSGQVFFLINGMSFSAAAEFCSIAKNNNRGMFIGEETGGGYYGNNSGDFAVVKLPNTNISIYIPTTKYVMDVKKAKYDNRGIIPDYEVIPTINDILTAKDVQLDFTLKLAGQP